MDKYLSFETESQAKAVLYRIEGDENEVANYANIDIIGTIYKGGEFDEEGNVIAAPIAMSGWHVNVSLVDGEDAEILAPFEVNPVTPERVWA